MDTLSESYHIRLVKESDDIEAITLMIRRAYKVLLDKGFRYWGTFQSVEDTQKRFNSGDAFVVECEGEVIGTVTFKKEYVGSEETPWYDRSEVCHFSQFAVKPEFQKSGLGSLMMTYLENYAKELGFKEMALDTCEEATSLINYYEKRGYRFVEHVQWDPEVVNYRSVVLSKSL